MRIMNGRTSVTRVVSPLSQTRVRDIVRLGFPDPKMQVPKFRGEPAGHMPTVFPWNFRTRFREFRENKK